MQCVVGHEFVKLHITCCDSFFILHSYIFAKVFFIFCSWLGMCFKIYMQSTQYWACKQISTVTMLHTYHSTHTVLLLDDGTHHHPMHSWETKFTQTASSDLLSLLMKPKKMMLKHWRPPSIYLSAYSKLWHTHPIFSWIKMTVDSTSFSSTGAKQPKIVLATKKKWSSTVWQILHNIMNMINILKEANPVGTINLQRSTIGGSNYSQNWN